MSFPSLKPLDLDSVKSESSSSTRAVQGTIMGKLTLSMYYPKKKGNSTIALHFKSTFSIYLDS